MPLLQGSDKQTIEQNTKTEIDAGKPPNQAYAIANAMARRAKKMDDAAFPKAQESAQITGTN